MKWQAQGKGHNNNKSMRSDWEEGVEEGGSTTRNEAANGRRNVLDEARALPAADSCASAV